MRGAHGLATFSGRLYEGLRCCLGGETEPDSPLIRGRDRLAADLTRREVWALGVVSRRGGDVGPWFRCVRVDCSWDTEPGVALLEPEPVPVRKRDMPSAGIEGSGAMVEV